MGLKNLQPLFRVMDKRGAMYMYKEYKTRKGAERYLSRLRKKYSYVVVDDWPASEDGVYVFKIK